MAQQMTGECYFGLHAHCPGHSVYGAGGADGVSVSLPCECACHGARQPAPTPVYRWRRDPVTGKRYLASVKMKGA